MVKGKRRNRKKDEKTSIASDYEMEKDVRFTDALECYVFNDALDPILDDGACEHCKYFLTTKCPHVDEFIEEVEDMELDI